MKDWDIYKKYMKLTLNKIKNYNLIHIYCKLNEIVLKLLSSITKTLFFRI